MTAFQEMIDALFSDAAVARTITYTPVAGTARTLRAVIKSPDKIVDVREMAIHTPTLVVDVRVLDVATPQEGDTLTIGTLLYVPCAIRKTLSGRWIVILDSSRLLLRITAFLPLQAHVY
jgi:hypothetical protein